MPKAGWILVDTLEPDRVTVIARERDPKERLSFENAVIEKIGDKAPGREATRWLLSVIEHMRDRPVRACPTITLKNGRHVRAEVVPVVGPDQVTLHAAQIWIGSPDVKPDTQPAPAYGFTWDAGRRVAGLPPPLVKPAVGRSAARTTLIAPEVFRFLDVSDGLGLVRAILTASKPGAVWQGKVALTLSDQRVPAWMVMVSGHTPDEVQCWRGVLFETSQRVGGHPSLESMTWAAMPLVSLTHMVLMDVAKMRLIRWLTDPVPAIQWKGMVDNRDAPHPDDVKRIFEAAAELLNGRADSAQVDGIRLRRSGGGWTVVNASGGVISTASGPTLALIQMHVVGESDDPDPVTPDDQGSPGLEEPNR